MHLSFISASRVIVLKFFKNIAVAKKKHSFKIFQTSLL